MSRIIGPIDDLKGSKKGLVDSMNDKGYILALDINNYMYFQTLDLKDPFIKIKYKEVENLLVVIGVYEY